MKWASATTAHLRSAVSINTEQVRDILTPAQHSVHVQRHRAELIISRVQLISAAFAVLTPLWIVVDMWAFPWPIWGILAGLRLISSGLFIALAWPWRMAHTFRAAFLMLLAMLLNPPLFYLASLPLFAGQEFAGAAEVVAGTYGLLPFIMVAGLSVFPLTAIEVAAISATVFVLAAAGTATTGGIGPAGYFGTMWLLVLVIGVAMVSGMSHLHYMIALVNRATHDVLTDAFTRRSGTETLDLQFHISAMHQTPLTVLFVDVDDFKRINDEFGHEAGDAALKQCARHLREQLRRGDLLVRWGGEEFVVVLTNTDCRGAFIVVDRLSQTGLGNRPDGRPLTVSVGMAERIGDGVYDWPQLVELADQRMYVAKRAGKNRCVSCGGEMHTLLPEKAPL
jgi:diguanylate cyclase (GGDEF)-like protein